MLDLRVIIFNVEHGFCSFIKSPTGHTLLIDCGKATNFSPIQYILDNELHDTAKYQNWYDLTKFVLTHPHGDHVEDIDRLSGTLTPAMIYRQKNYDWQSVKEDNTEQGAENVEAYKEWQETYTQPIQEPDWGMTILHNICLSPSEAAELNKAKFVNNSSIPIMIKFRGSKHTEKFFFSGDLEEAAWKELMKNDNFKNNLKGTNFFITPHHGHSTGYCKEIFEVMGKPIVNIVSARSRDESVEAAYSSPDNATGVNLKNEKRYMLTTRKDGTIFIQVDSEGKYSIAAKHLQDNLKPQRTY